MSEPRLNEALRRLRDRAAAAALTDDARSIGSGNFRAHVRQTIVEEIRGSGFETPENMRLRLSDLEQKVDELIQIIGTLDSEPPPTRPPEPPGPEAIRSYAAPSSSYLEEHRPRSRWKRTGIIAVFIVAVILGALGLILAVGDHLPLTVTSAFNEFAYRFGPSPN
jgi:hypothetical protein